MKSKHEPRIEKKHRIFRAIQDMKKRGVKSITLEVIADELAYNEGYSSAKCPEGRKICHGLAGLLKEMLKDKTLHLSNKVAYNIS